MPKKAKAEDAFRPLTYASTELHNTMRDAWDAEATVGGVRLYCTEDPRTYGKGIGRWHLQVRAQVKTKRGASGKLFGIGIASMGREDLVWLRDQIDAELKRK